MHELEWITAPSPVAYETALSFMDSRVKAIRDEDAPQTVWLLEHPPLYTAGTSAKREDLLDAARFPVHEAGRGGQFTYHGPGQRVAYVMLDLKRRSAISPEPDVRAYVSFLENWVIRVLKGFGLTGRTYPERVGVWVDNGKGGEAKIAAIGIRIRSWITFHGISLNVNPNLSHFTGIVPCGISEHGVTSLHALGINVTMDEVDAALKREFEKIYGFVI